MKGPDHRLARQVLPAPLYRALRHVFDQGIAGCMLVGGTALAGYYAGHRRSDDLDLFARDAPAHQAMVLAVESLAIDVPGAEVVTRQRALQFYHAVVRLDGHELTAQVVLDAGLFAMGEGVRAQDGVTVASLETLLKQKAATLVSRCAEKDLYDVKWLLGQLPHLKPSDLVELGSQVDGGMTAETVLISLTSTTLREEACGFSHHEEPSEVFRQVSDLKEDLTQSFDRLASRRAESPLGELVRRLR
jgi:hypothetical protein